MANIPLKNLILKLQKKCLRFAEKYWPESSKVKEIGEQLEKREQLVGHAEYCEPES
ncbi:MAG: hypothetical protein AB9861_18080 [Methanosarcina sp.]|uniref:hypothetical protein n=1 Tax=Methanosarcina sp. DH2 TaxID=2605639 RepID=UPI001E29E38D|nr:hypothetical protein [Methanosarcina sp. DH2]MCC4770882.1 hypothetical protein [Methanosarcina sp. DH2]